MAGAAEKKQARYNAEILKQIHLISVTVNFLSLICLFVFHRPGSKKPFFIFSIPGWISEYAIEKIGRPTYKKDDIRGFQMLLSAGEDLRQEGLTEYIFDVFYLTEACDIFMCLFGSNQSYWILVLIPIYAVYKLVSLWLRFRSGNAGNSQFVQQDEQHAQPKSKRQKKLEARQKKTRYVRS